MSYLVISASLNPGSRSRLLALEALSAIQRQGGEAEILNLAEHPLPMCDGDAVYDDPRVPEVSKIVRDAEGILLAVPVYNYDANAAAKNLMELTGSAWEEKVVGFLCAAGGQGSYMSIMSFANSLMLDFRCLILPRYIYATASAFEGKSIADQKILDRIDGLAKQLIQVSRALSKS